MTTLKDDNLKIGLTEQRDTRPESVRPGDGLSLDVFQLQCLMNALDFCFFDVHGTAMLEMHEDFPNLGRLTPNQFQDIRTELVRERLRIDPEYRNTIGHRHAVGVEKSKRDRAGMRNEAKTKT